MPEAGPAADLPLLCLDVLVGILKCLSQQDRLHHAPSVCKLLCAAAYQATADASINLPAAASAQCSLEHFKSWLERAGAAHLQTLHIKGARAAYWLLNAPQQQVQLPWSSLTALRQLSLSRVVLPAEDLQQHLGHLTSLTLHRVSNSGTLLPHLPRGLRQLAIHTDGQQAVPAEQQAWFTLGSRLTQLTSLLLDRCGLTDPDLQLLTAFRQLQQLKLWHNRLVQPWASVQQLSNLTLLDIMSADPLSIAAMPSSNSNASWLGTPQLQELRCGSNVLLQDPLSSGPVQLPLSLTKLEACGWRFATAAAAESLLLQTLPRLKHLQQLQLLCCEFLAGTSPGAFSGLGQLSGLTSLNMSGCMVPRGACSTRGLFRPGALPRLQQLLLHALSYSPFTARDFPAVGAVNEGCLVGLTAACPALRRLDIRGLLAVEAGGMAALTRLMHLTSIEVDTHWYSVLDEAAVAALEQLRKKAAASAAAAATAATVVTAAEAVALTAAHQ